MFLLILFVVASVAATVFGLVLRARQAGEVGRHRNAVPAEFGGVVSLEEHQRAADYERARLRLGAGASVSGLVVALCWALFGYDALYGAVAGVIPAGNWLSRRHEYEADDFAQRIVGAEPMIAALMRLARDNATTITPDPLHALVNFRYPPVPLRVRRLQEASGARQGTSA